MKKLTALLLCFATVFAPAAQAAGSAEERPAENLSAEGTPVLPALPGSALSGEAAVPPASADAAAVPESVDAVPDLGEAAPLGVPLESAAGAETAAKATASSRVAPSGQWVVRPTKADSKKELRLKDLMLAKEGADKIFDGEKNQEDGGQAPAPSFGPKTSRSSGTGAGQKPASSSSDRVSRNKRSVIFVGGYTKSQLLSYDPKRSVSGAIKLVYPNSSSEYYKGIEKIRRGALINIVQLVDDDGIKIEENVFGQSVRVLKAYKKAIGRLTKKDFKAAEPAMKLRKLSIEQLRNNLVQRLENNNEGRNEVTLETPVKVMKWQSYTDLYRETHQGQRPKRSQAVPQAPIKVRTPLVVKAEGPLEHMSRFIRKVHYVDLDELKGPLSEEVLADMVDLSNANVFFVAFSRKPFDFKTAPRDSPLKQMAERLSWHLTAVTDDGTVISVFPKKGGAAIENILPFSPQKDEARAVQEAARRAAQDVGLDAGKIRMELSYPKMPDARGVFGAVGLEVTFKNGTDQKSIEKWRAAFHRWLGKKYKIGVFIRQGVGEDGGVRFVVRKTSVEQMAPRVAQVLDEHFDTFYGPSDILVLSSDPAMRQINKHFNFAQITGLKGQVMVENALGLELGEVRQATPVAMKASVTRITNFMNDPDEYMYNALRINDGEKSMATFGGGIVHAVNSWFVQQLIAGRRPSWREHAAKFNTIWRKRLLDLAATKPVILPSADKTENYREAYLARSRRMIQHVLRKIQKGARPRATEQPVYMSYAQYEPGTAVLKSQLHLRGTLDLVMDEPNPDRPGHGTRVIGDYKTGRPKSNKKLNHDDQARHYLMTGEKLWGDQPVPVPGSSLSGQKIKHIGDVKTEFIYSAITKPVPLSTWDLQNEPDRLIRWGKKEHAARQELNGLASPKPSKSKSSKKGKKKK